MFFRRHDFRRYLAKSSQIRPRKPDFKVFFQDVVTIGRILMKISGVYSIFRVEFDFEFEICPNTPTSIKITTTSTTVTARTSAAPATEQ